MTIARLEDGTVVEMRDLSIDDVPEHKRYMWAPVVYDGDGPITTTSVHADHVVVTRSHPPPDSAAVDAERDRRLRYVSFGGKSYDFMNGKDAADNISGASILALAAIMNGAQPGNLRWANPDRDFTWIAADNTTTPMDAQATFAFGQAAASWKSSHFHAARTIKDLSPIPADYADNARWPT